MVIKDNVTTIYSKTRMDKELKSDGQGHKISFLKNG